MDARVARAVAAREDWSLFGDNLFGLRLASVFQGSLSVLLTYLIAEFANPLASLVVTPLFGHDLPYAASFLIVGYLGLLHYYTEVFTWKHGSPYRRHVALSA